ncbi:hypothetical protein TorRG33x02_011220, partial [Trema orientale]
GGPLTAWISGRGIYESRGASRCLGILTSRSDCPLGQGFLVMRSGCPLGQGLLVARLGYPLGRGLLVSRSDCSPSHETAFLVKKSNSPLSRGLLVAASWSRGQTTLLVEASWSRGQSTPRFSSLVPFWSRGLPSNLSRCSRVLYLGDENYPQ